MKSRRPEHLAPRADLRPAPGGLRRDRPLTGREIALRYAAFAAVAVACNLAAQRIVLAALRQGEMVALGWAPELLDWALDDVLGLLSAGWRADVGAPLGLTLAIAAGTATGLVVKYLLDKRWIFADRSRGVRAHARRFPLYAATGAITTAIFWGTEAAAWAIWGTDAAREAGAVLGLTVGYVSKYRLDRNLVFTSGPEGPA